MSEWIDNYIIMHNIKMKSNFFESTAHFFELLFEIIFSIIRVSAECDTKGEKTGRRK